MPSYLSLPFPLSVPNQPFPRNLLTYTQVVTHQEQLNSWQNEVLFFLHTHGKQDTSIASFLEKA